MLKYSQNHDEVMFDQRYKVFNYEKYLQDCDQKQFNKLCMTEIVNADMMIANFGEETYVKSCREVLTTISDTFEKLHLENSIFVYILNYKNFIVATNDSIDDNDFAEMMHGFYEEYELATAQQTALSGISRFVLVFGKENMVDRAKSTLFVNRKRQDNFIVSTNQREQLIEETQKNVTIFELLNYAINNDKVIPFYQGLRNNKTGKIEKYEALMRIYGKDNNIYAPGFFLENAKSFKLYLALNRIIIDKSLTLFEKKDEELTLNISLFDVQSDEFRDWFFNRIKRHPTPSKVTLEFVETEDYKTNKLLYSFLKELREHDCKIAVDDFGAGFATYTSIISLKPDIIKIDGGIIKDLVTKPENQIIVDSICYMAKLINSQTVAEYVENEAIQNMVLKNDINFSQGYHFAKPTPFHQLS